MQVVALTSDCATVCICATINDHPMKESMYMCMGVFMRIESPHSESFEPIEVGVLGQSSFDTLCRDGTSAARHRSPQAQFPLQLTERFAALMRIWT